MSDQPTAEPMSEDDLEYYRCIDHWRNARDAICALNLVAEIDRLRAANAELAAEVKLATKKRAEAIDKQDALAARVNELESQLNGKIPEFLPAKPKVTYL